MAASHTISSRIRSLGSISLYATEISNELAIFATHKYLCNFDYE